MFLPDLVELGRQPIDSPILVLGHSLVLLQTAPQSLHFRHDIPQVDVISLCLLFPLQDLLPHQPQLVVLPKDR